DVGRLPLAVSLLALGALLTVAYLVFRPLAAPRSLPDAEARRVAKGLVRRYGTDTLAFFKLRRDKQYLFDKAGSAFLAYRIENGGYLAELAELAQLDERTLSELEAVTERWLAGAAERGFSMSMDSLRTEREAGGVVLLARDSEGRIRGFLHLVPSYGRPAMSLSSMRRDRETPNGLMEFLVVRAIEALRERGVEEISLNFAAFARVMHGPRGPLERLVGRLVALGNPYFQIESLYRFNAKFFPRWEPRYLLYEGTLGLPRAGLAVMRAEGQLPKPRRRGSAEGTLLLCDAWFDTVTSQPGWELAWAAAEALVAELPLAAFCFWIAFDAESVAMARRFVRAAASTSRSEATG